MKSMTSHSVLVILTSSTRRYLAAVKALAQVRRPRPPAVQVYTGDQQVNVVG